MLRQETLKLFFFLLKREKISLYNQIGIMKKEVNVLFLYCYLPNKLPATFFAFFAIKIACN